MNQALMNQLSDSRSGEEIQRLEDSLIQLRSALDQSEADKKTLKNRIGE